MRFLKNFSCCFSDRFSGSSSAGRFGKFLFGFICAFFFSTLAAGFDVPRLSGEINDEAGLLSRRVEKQFESALANFRRQGGAHIAVLTVRDLQGEPIEQASIQVTDRWKLGDDKKDNGVLLMVAKEERKVRIEVGQGLEASLPDAYAKRIIDQVIVPLFREGEIEKGIMLGLHQIAGKTNPDLTLFSGSSVSKGSKNWKNKRKTGVGIRDIFTIIIFLLLFLFGGRSTLFGFLLGSSLGGGRSYGGGSFGGGGGFSGGGGGFSGGGASGSW